MKLKPILSTHKEESLVLRSLRFWTLPLVVCAELDKHSSDARASTEGSKPCTCHFEAIPAKIQPAKLNLEKRQISTPGCGAEGPTRLGQTRH